MKLIRGLHNLTRSLPASAVTIGNFDGVHLGHQLVISQLREVAEAARLPTVVIIFEPQPIEFFAPDKAPKRLARFREKIAYLKAQHIDYLLCLHFNAELAGLSADEFVQGILVDRLGTANTWSSATIFISVVIGRVISTICSKTARASASRSTKPNRR